jgi:hypothetical protein
VKELVQFDCAVTKDGACGGTRGAIHLRWKPGQDIYNEKIARSLTHTRFLQLKRVLKLNDNDRTPKKGQPGHVPCSKYNLIYEAIVHNTNVLTTYADIDQCLDETTWGYGGFGEAGSGVVSRAHG